jgi:L-seryl-tRNA(Ser) seleniumtransferase
MQLHGIGRSMKVGKESYFGLLQALDEYIVKEDTSEAEIATLQALLPLNELQGVGISIVQDEAGRAIFRARVHIDPQQAGTTASRMATELQNGPIAIYTRDYGVKQGYFDLDPRSLRGDDIQVIAARIRELAGGN